MVRGSTTPVLTVALAAAALLLVACSDDPDTPASGEDVATPSAPADQVEATLLTEVAASGTELTPGLYAMGFASDRTDPPMLVVDVPAGYTGRGDGYEISAEEGSFRHFDTWTVAEVATQACGSGDWVDPGPGVEDLAEALAALPVWQSTEPAPVTIDGHEGVVMELNVPADLPAGCSSGPHSWRDFHGSTQGVGPGKTQRVWIVDVDGQRLMMVAGYFPGPEGPSPGQIDEMTTMAEGGVFVDADQIAP